MEKALFRDNLRMLCEMFPGKAAIDVKETAKVLGISEDCVRDAMKRRYNPLPSKRISRGKIIVPLASLANYMAGS